METENKPIFEIIMNGKRSWGRVREILKSKGYNVDLRKASKKNVPLLIETKCCDSRVAVRRVKDFPLEDVKCECGKYYLLKWKEQLINPKKK